eukprot:15435706-Alexandrium_andersonii.AAC.1
MQFLYVPAAVFAQPPLEVSVPTAWRALAGCIRQSTMRPWRMSTTMPSRRLPSIMPGHLR